MKTRYEFIRDDKEYLKKYTGEKLKSLKIYKKLSDPVGYFVDFARYEDIFSLVFESHSPYWVTLSMIEKNLKRYFFSFKVKRENKMIILSLSFSDLLKFMIVNEIRQNFWTSKELINRILLLLSHKVHKMFSKLEILNPDLYSYMNDTELYSLIYLKEHTKIELKDKINGFKKEIKENKIEILYQCFEDDTFEKVLYYIMNYDKPWYLFLLFSNQWIERLEYVYTKLWILSKSWIWVDISDFVMLNSRECDSLLKNKRDNLTKDRKDKEVIMKKKSDHILLLEQKRRNISIEDVDNDKLYDVLSYRINKNKLERDIGIYDIEEEKFDLFNTKDIGNPEIIKQMFEEVCNQLIHICPDDVTLTIKGKVINNEKFLEIKEQIPYGNVWFDRKAGNNKGITFKLEKNLKKYKKKLK